MSKLAERFLERLERVGVQADEGEAAAKAYAERAGHMVSALVPKQLRRAVLDRQRLVDEWPIVEELNTAFLFPGNVAPDDVRHALGRTGNKMAAALARGIGEHGFPFVVNAAPLMLNAFADQMKEALVGLQVKAGDDKAAAALRDDWGPLLTAFAAAEKAMNRLGDELDNGAPTAGLSSLAALGKAVAALEKAPLPAALRQRKLSRSFEAASVVLEAMHDWPMPETVLVVSVTKDVEEDQRRPAVRVSAKPPSRSAIRALSEGGPRGDLTGWTGGGQDGQGGYALVLGGKRYQAQLSLRLPDVGADLSASLVRQLLDTFKEDGVRDWLVLHDMAQQQGGTGRFRWSWREHRELGGYDRRRQNAKGRTELDIAREVVKRLVAFKGTELRMERKRNGRIEWVRVGDFGLIDIPAGVDELLDDGTRLTTVAAVRLNPGLYRGAAVGEQKPYFALVDQSVLRMGRIPQMLAVYFALNARVAHDAGGVGRFKARTLWDYAAVEGRAWQARKRWPRAQGTLERALDDIAKVTGWTWEREDEGRNIADTVYRVTPPPWWTDRVMLGVPAIAALPSTAGVPRTGTELAAWRTEHGLPLREVAALVGTSPATVMRAERKADAALPDGWAGKLARARKAMQGW